jgi:hypothetical protein
MIDLIVYLLGFVLFFAGGLLYLLKHWELFDIYDNDNEDWD